MRPILALPNGLMIGPVQESGLKRAYDLYLSTMQSGLNALPDWRSTAFWRESSFLQAWQKAREWSGVETGAELKRLECALLSAS